MYSRDSQPKLAAHRILFPQLVSIFFLLLLLSKGVYGQSTVKVSGRLIDDNLAPLTHATVQLLTRADSLPISSHSTDSTGRFFFENHPDTYLLMIAHLGYQTHFETLYLDGKTENVDLGNLTLFERSATIEAVQVNAPAPRLIEQRADRLIVNVENSILSTGLTALEVLQRSPSVQVDDEGNIQMRGQPGVRILLNGKLSYLSPSELANLLKSTPSSQIEKIELIANPSSKYDAAGSAGLINIVMKREHRAGLNGSVHAFGGAGRKARYGGGGSINFRKDALNLHATYDQTYRGEEEYRYIYRDYGEIVIPAQNSEQYSLTNEPLRAHNSKIVAEYELTENWSIGSSWTGNFGTYENYGHGYNNVINSESGELLSNALAENAQVSKWQTHTLNLNATRKFADNELTADFDYLYSNFDSDQDLISDFKQTNHQSPFRSWRRGSTPSTTRLYIGKMDYVHHLGVQQRLETGWKSSWIDADNNFVNDTLRNQGWDRDETTSNHFQYLEQIHAGYVNYNIDYNQWQMTAGLRMEHTISSGIQWTWDERIDRSYTHWFPSLSVGYQVDSTNSIQLSYSKRIERPDYDNLNPFRFYVDAFVFWEGNPDLKPQLAHSFQATHLFGNSLSTSLYFTQVNEVMTSVLTQVPSANQTIRSIANIDGFRNIGVNVNHQIKPLPAWTMITNLNAFHNRFYGEFNKEQIDTRNWQATLISTHTLQLGKGWTGEVTGSYYSKSLDGVFMRDAFGMVSSGVMKRLAGDKLTLKLSVNDIFKTMNYSTSSSTNGVAMRQNFNLDSRVALLTLHYKFGGDFDFKSRKSKTENEQQRVRGGS